MIIIIGALLIYACKHQIAAPINNTGGNTGTDSSSGNNNFGLCFQSDILPIFQTNCAKSGCHNAASHKDGYILDSYENIVRDGIEPGRRENSKIYKIITEDDKDDRMPQTPNAPLTQEQIDLIGQWIDEGADNTTNCSTGCDTTLFTYSGAVKPILDLHCMGCHNNSIANAGINLTTYDGVNTVALNGKLAGAINWSSGYTPMPYQQNKLDDCSITKIMKWINEGAVNN